MRSSQDVMRCSMGHLVRDISEAKVPSRVHTQSSSRPFYPPLLCGARLLLPPGIVAAPPPLSPLTTRASTGGAIEQKYVKVP